MKTKLKFLVNGLIIIAFLVGNIYNLNAQNFKQIYQKGLVKEEGEGALQEAIDLYNQIAVNSNAGNSLRAKSLLHIGMCYEKMGKQEATKAYQLLVTKFPGQQNEVAIARERLSELLFIPKKVMPKSIIVQKVWGGPDANFNGTVSPDGKFLTYMNYNTGNLAIRTFKTGENKDLMNETDTIDHRLHVYSVVSPDSKRIVYNRYNYKIHREELKIVDVNNPLPKLLLTARKDEDITAKAWSPDGKIIYAHADLYEPSVNRILAITVKTGAVQVLKSFNFSFNTDISVSPDGQHIAFNVPNIRRGGRKADIHIMSKDGKNETSIIEHPADDRLLGWLPDGNQILFKSDRSGTWDAWIVSIEKGKASWKSKRILPEMGKAIPLGFTKKGAYYYSLFSRKFTTTTMPIDISKGRLDFEYEKPMLSSVPWAEISPDGKLLAYIKDLGPTLGPHKYHRPLFILDIETGKERELSDWFVTRNPRWSPDGKMLVVVGVQLWDDDFKAGIYTIQVKTGEIKELITFNESQENDMGFLYNRSVAEWSKDQKYIFYTLNDRIVKREVATGQEKIIVQNKNLTHSLDISPDGEDLLFGVGNQLDSKAISGGKETKLFAVEEGKKIGRITWSPDGNYIFFTEVSKNYRDETILWRITSEGKQPKEVYKFNGSCSSLSIYPNGGKIVLSIYNDYTEVWRLDNLISE